MRKTILANKTDNFNVNFFIDNLEQNQNNNATRKMENWVDWNWTNTVNYMTTINKKHNLNLVEYLPDYERYGRGAPLVRNKLIVENCDSVLAFWDGQSRGTKFTLDYAKELGKPVKIVKI